MKINLTFLILCLILAINTHAFEVEGGESRLVCATRHLTTSYVLSETPEHYELHVVHHLGAEFMPFHEGLITPYDIPRLSKLAETFQKMGDRYIVRFAKDQCLFNQGEWNCYSSNSVTVGQLEVKNYSFHVSQRRVITKLVDYQSHRVRFSVTIGNEGFTLPMEYPIDECLFY